MHNGSTWFWSTVNPKFSIWSYRYESTVYGLVSEWLWPPPCPQVTYKMDSIAQTVPVMYFFPDLEKTCFFQIWKKNMFFQIWKKIMFFSDLEKNTFFLMPTPNGSQDRWMHNGSTVNPKSIWSYRYESTVLWLGATEYRHHSALSFGTL